MNPPHNLHKFLTMYYVYLLQSLKDKSLYIGCTLNLKQRIAMHNQNKSCYTKKHSPWRLVYFEAFVSRQDAYSREKTLKLHKQGLQRLTERLCNSLIM